MLRKILTSSLLTLVIVGGFFVNIKPESESVITFVDQTYAADCGGTGQTACTSDQEMVNMYNKMVGALNIALDILSFIVTPAIMLAGWLMSPDWTSGDLFNLRPVLHDLWVLVSNITYFIYALLLIFIALATIFNSQNYGYKKLLPRLALGIILVPLTWWFVQFIISLSTIVTASVMNMPTDVMDKLVVANGSDTWWTTPSIPKDYEFYTDDEYEGINGKTQYNPDTLLSPKDILTNSAGIYGSLIIYGNGLFKFNEIQKLSTTTNVVQSIGALVNKGLLGVVMFVVFGFLVIALIFMLMMRAIKLWFYAIFSPLLTLRYVVGDGLFGGKDNASSFEFKEFIGLAFVPALVGLALSFGIVVIAVLQSATLGSNVDTCDASKMQPGAAGCQIIGIMGSNANYIKKKVEELDVGENGNTEIINVTVTEVVFGGVSFKFYGSIITDIAEYAASASTYSSVLSATGSVFGTLIIDIIALIFLWSAFMAAKSVSSVARAAFEPFEKIGTQVGRLALSVPKYTPIPGTNGLSIYGAGKVVDNASRAVETAHDEEFKNSRWGKMFGGDRFISKAAEERMVAAIKSGERSKLQDDIRATANLSEGYRGEQVKAFRDHMSGMSREDQNRYLDKLKVDNPDVRKQILDFMGDKTKSKLSADTDRKELWDLMKSAVGATTGAKGGNNTAAGFNAGRIASSDSVNVTLNGGTPITIKNKAGDDAISLNTEDLKKQVTGKNNVVDKDGFIKSLMASNAMTAKAAESVAKEIEKINKDYFKKADDGTAAKSSGNPPPAPPAAPAGPAGPTAAAPRSTDQFSQENWTG